jgi:hypothetical protein
LIAKFVVCLSQGPNAEVPTVRERDGDGDAADGDSDADDDGGNDDEDGDRGDGGDAKYDNDWKKLAAVAGDALLGDEGGRSQNYGNY